MFLPSFPIVRSGTQHLSQYVMITDIYWNNSRKVWSVQLNGKVWTHSDRFFNLSDLNLAYNYLVNLGIIDAF